MVNTFTPFQPEGAYTDLQSAYDTGRNLSISNLMLGDLDDFTPEQQFHLQMGLDPYDLTLHSNSLIRQIGTDNWIQGMNQLSDSDQRAAWLTLDEAAIKDAIEAGYEGPPDPSERNWLQAAWKYSPLGLASSVGGWTLGKTVWPVAKGAFKGAEWLWQRSTNLWRTFSQADAGTQIAMLGGATLAVGGTLATIGTGGLASPITAPLTFLGTTTLLGATAAAGAAAGGVTAGTADAVFGTDAPSHQNFFELYSATWDGEKYFTPETRQRNAELLGHSAYSELAANISDNPEFDQNRLVEILVGQRDPLSNPATIVDTATKLIEESFVRGTPEFDRAIQSMAILLNDPKFTYALQDYQNSKVTFGRDIANTLGIDRDSWMYNAVSGTGDALFAIFADPLNLIGGAGSIRQSRNIWKGLALSLDRRAILQVVDEANPSGFIRQAVEQKPAARQIFTNIADSFNSGRIEDMPTHFRASTFNMLDFFRNKGIMNEAGQFTREVDADDVLDYWDSTQGLTDLLQGRGLRRGERMYLDARTSDSIRGKLTRGLRNFRDAYDEQTSLKVIQELIDGSEYQTLDQLFPQQIFSNEQIGVVKLFDPVVDETQSTVMGKLGASLAYVTGQNNTLRNFLVRTTNMAPRKSITDFKDPIELMRYIETMGDMMSLPKSMRQTWVNTVLMQATPVGRANAFHGFLSSYFKLLNYNTIDETSEFAQQSLKSIGQIFDFAGKDLLPTLDGTVKIARASFPHQVAEHASLPDVQTLVTMNRRLHYAKFFGDAGATIDTIMRVWRPTVLMRMGKFARDVGEDVLAFMARAQTNGLTAELTAQGYAKRQTVQRANWWAENNKGTVMPPELQRAANYKPYTRGLNTIARLGPDGIVGHMLNNFQRWIDGVLTNGLVDSSSSLAQAQRNWSKKWQAGDLTKAEWLKGLLLYNKPGSWRSIGINGLDPELVNYATKSLTSRATAAMHAVSNTQEGQIAQVLSAPREQELPLQLMANNEFQRFYADTGGYNAALHDSRQRIISDRIMRDVWMDVVPRAMSSHPNHNPAVWGTHLEYWSEMSPMEQRIVSYILDNRPDALRIMDYGLTQNIEEFAPDSPIAQLLTAIRDDIVHQSRNFDTAGIDLFPSLRQIVNNPKYSELLANVQGAEFQTLQQADNFGERLLDWVDYVWPQMAEMPHELRQHYLIQSGYIAIEQQDARQSGQTIVGAFQPERLQRIAQGDPTVFGEEVPQQWLYRGTRSGVNDRNMVVNDDGSLTITVEAQSHGTPDKSWSHYALSTSIYPNQALVYASGHGGESIPQGVIYAIDRQTLMDGFGVRSSFDEVTDTNNLVEYEKFGDEETKNYLLANGWGAIRPNRPDRAGAEFGEIMFVQPKQVPFGEGADGTTLAEPMSVTIPAGKWKTLTTQEMAVDVPSPWDAVLWEWDDFIRSKVLEKIDVKDIPVNEFGEPEEVVSEYPLDVVTNLFGELDKTIQSFRSLREVQKVDDSLNLRRTILQEMFPGLDEAQQDSIFNMIRTVYGDMSSTADYTYPWLEELGVTNLEETFQQFFQLLATKLDEEYSPVVMAMFDYHVRGINAINDTWPYEALSATETHPRNYKAMWMGRFSEILDNRTNIGPDQRVLPVFRNLIRLVDGYDDELSRFMWLMNNNNLDPRAVKYRTFVERMSFDYGRFDVDTVGPIVDDVTEADLADDAVFRQYEADIEATLMAEEKFKEQDKFLRVLLLSTTEQYGSSYNPETRALLQSALNQSIGPQYPVDDYNWPDNVPFVAAFHDWIFGDSLSDSYRSILLNQFDDLRARGQRTPVSNGAPLYASLGDARQELVDRVFMQLMTHKHTPEIQNMQRAVQTETKSINPNNSKTVYTASLTNPQHFKTNYIEALLGVETAGLTEAQALLVQSEIVVDRLMQTPSARQAQNRLLNANNEQELRNLLQTYVAYLIKNDKVQNMEYLPKGAIVGLYGVGTSNPRYAAWVQDVLNGTQLEGAQHLRGFNMPYNAPDRLGDVYRPNWENITFVDYTPNGSTYTFNDMTSSMWTTRFGEPSDLPLTQEQGFQELAETMVDSFFDNVGARTTENRYAREGVYKKESGEFVEVPVGTLINNNQPLWHMTPEGSFARIANNGTSSDSKYFTYELAQSGDTDDVMYGLIAPMIMDEMDKRLGWTMIAPQNEFNLKAGQALEDDFFYYQRSHLEDVATVDKDKRPNVAFGPSQVVETPQTFQAKLDRLVDQALEGTARPVFRKLGELADTFSRQPMFQHFYMHALDQNYGLAGLFVRQGDVDMLSELFDPTLLGDLAGRYGFKPHELAFNLADIFQDIPEPMLQMVVDGKMTLRQLNGHLIRSAQQGIDPNVAAVRKIGFDITEKMEGRDQEIGRAILALQSIQSKAEGGAAQQTVTKVLPFIDSHNERSIASLYVRNLMPFLYAEENFIKRWMRIVVDNGYSNFSKLHDARLVAQGLNTSGYIREDDNGNYWLVYPGSGVALDTVGRLSNLIGYDNPNLPAVFQARLDRLLPGVNESAGRPQFGPLGTMPVQAITSLFPETKEVADLRRAVLGEYGASRSFIGQIVPTQFSSLFDALTRNEDDGYIAYGSMWSNTIAMLAAKGQLPDENAEPAEWETFINRTRNGTRINLVVQNLFGLLAPMPGRPTTLLVEEKDFGWWTGLGIEDPRQLINDTFYSYLSLYGLEEGTARYLAENPNADLSTIVNPLALTVGKTKSTLGTSLPATEIARDWVFANDDVVSKYPNGYAWFVPGRGFDNDTPEGKFSQFFFNEQMENEVRRYLIDESPQSAKLDAIPGMNRFLEAVIFKGQAAEYFATIDYYDNAIEMAGSSTTQGKQLQEQKSAYIDLYEVQHPVFADLKNSQNGRQQRQETIRDITRILANPDEMLDSPYSQPIRELHENFEIYKIELARLSDSNTTYFRTQRANWKEQWKNIGDYWALVNPDIAMLWTTVYEPESNL